MQQVPRYAGLFGRDDRTPDSFWTSLRYFNIYRMAVAALFLGITLFFGDTLNLGSHQLNAFKLVCVMYLIAGVVFHSLMRNLRDLFNLQLSLSGNDREHTTYTQGVSIVIEFNRYGPLRSGAGGNSIKDRSVGTVVRYNRIDEGARAVDLVEAEDFPVYALRDPAYRTTFVYGNQIKKNGNTGSVIHYGGDHFGSAPGANWGEPLFRRGTLYFFNNTLYITGDSAELFQIDTTLERAEIYNNVFVFADSVAAGYRSVRAQREVGAGWTPGGIVNLGRNWISNGWADSDIYHPVQGQLIGSANMVSGATPPIDLNTLAPLAGSAVVDAAQVPPAGASAYSVNYQMSASFVPTARAIRGAAADLGAVER